MTHTLQSVSLTSADLAALEALKSYTLDLASTEDGTTYLRLTHVTDEDMDVTVCRVGDGGYHLVNQDETVATGRTLAEVCRAVL